MNRKGSLLTGFLFGAVASLPFAAWVVGRNYRLMGTFLGNRQLKGIHVLQNLHLSLARVSHWLLPRTLTDRIPFYALLAFGLVLLLLLNRRRDWEGFIRRLVISVTAPYWIFASIYLAFILLTTISADHLEFYDDRYQAPLYPFVMLFLGLAADELILTHLRRFQARSGWRLDLAQVALVAGFGVWLFFPAYGVYKYVLVSRTLGETSYNLYNTLAYRESQLVSFLVNME